jgi:hypothetical protein
LVEDKYKWEPGTKELDTENVKLCIFREFSEKYNQLMKQLSSGDRVFSTEIDIEGKSHIPEYNIVYSILDDNVKNISEIVKNRSLYINV